MARLVGELVTWREGYGFLRRDDGERDVFVHAKELRRAGVDDPQIGSRFSFVTTDGVDGRCRAIEVQREGVDAAARRVFAPVRP